MEVSPKDVEEDNSTEDPAVEVSQHLQPIPRLPPPFPRRHRKFLKFISMFRQLSVNISLVKAL